MKMFGVLCSVFVSRNYFLACSFVVPGSERVGIFLNQHVCSYGCACSCVCVCVCVRVFVCVCLCVRVCLFVFLYSFSFLAEYGAPVDWFFRTGWRCVGAWGSAFFADPYRPVSSLRPSPFFPFFFLFSLCVSRVCARVGVRVLVCVCVCVRVLVCACRVWLRAHFLNACFCVG